MAGTRNDLCERLGLHAGFTSSCMFLVSGKVIFVGPREGEYVKKDQVLAQIDPTDFRLSLKSAEAQRDRLHAAMEKAMNSVRPESLEQARIAYERAEDEYRRMKMLYESNSLAPNDFQKFKATYETAKQAYEQAKAGGQKEDKEQSKATYDQAEARATDRCESTFRCNTACPRWRLYLKKVDRDRRYGLCRPAGL